MTGRVVWKQARRSFINRERGILYDAIHLDCINNYPDRLTLRATIRSLASMYSKEEVCRRDVGIG